MFFRFGVPASISMDPGDTGSGDGGGDYDGGDDSGGDVDSDDFWRSGGFGDDDEGDAPSVNDKAKSGGKGRSIKDDIEDEDNGKAAKRKDPANRGNDGARGRRDDGGDDEDDGSDDEIEDTEEEPGESEEKGKKDTGKEGQKASLKVDLGDGKAAREVTADDVKTLVASYREARAVAAEYERVKPLLAEVNELHSLIEAKNVEGVLEFLGLDADTLHPIAEKITYDKYVESRMTPEEKAQAAEAKRKDEERRRDAEDAKRYREERERAETESRKAQVTQRVQTDIHTAIKSAGHPVTPELVDEVLGIMIASRNAAKAGKGERIDAKDAVQIAHKRLYGRAVPALKNLEGKQLLEAIGPDTLRKIRAAEVAQARGTGSRFPQTPRTETAPPPAGKKTKRTLTIDEALGFR